MPASRTRSKVAKPSLRPRVRTGLRSGANERATPAPADDDSDSDEGIKDDEYEENADKVEERAGAPFPRLARKLAASKWELDSARFMREFSPGMWRSRDFMRQLADWAETGAFSLEDALKAMAETRRHQANGTRPAQKGGSRINRKRRWTPQCLTNALVDLQENGLELDVAIRSNNHSKRLADNKQASPLHYHRSPLMTSVAVIARGSPPRFLRVH